MKLTFGSIPTILAIIIAVITCISLAIPLIRRLIENYLKTEYDTLFMSLSDKSINKIIKSLITGVFLFAFYIYSSLVFGFVQLLFISKGKDINEFEISNIWNIIMAVILVLFLITLITIIIGAMRTNKARINKIIKVPKKKKNAKKGLLNDIKIKSIIAFVNYLTYIWFSGFILILIVLEETNSDWVLPMFILSIIYPYFFTSYIKSNKIRDNYNYAFKVIENKELEQKSLIFNYAITEELLLLDAAANDDIEGGFYVYDRGEKVYYHFKKVLKSN